MTRDINKRMQRITPITIFDVVSKPIKCVNIQILLGMRPTRKRMEDEKNHGNEYLIGIFPARTRLRVVALSSKEMIIRRIRRERVIIC